MNEQTQPQTPDYIPLPSLETPWPTPVPKETPMTPTRRWIHRRFLATR